MMKYLSNLTLLIFTIFALSSCQTTSQVQLCDNEGDVCEINGLRSVLIKGGEFFITTYQKISDPKKPYVFYIEGDGAAFNGKYSISDNPTPRTRMMINLASIDERPNVVYIARPCQYTPMDLNPTCTIQYWTDKRMSEEVIVSINDVINSFDNGKKFSLVGYSGGGAVAVLVAARNPAVKDVLTIAGNLDHVAFTNSHRVSPMNGSLNPIDYAQQIKNIPQLHLSGGRDSIVKQIVTDRYIEESNSICVHKKLYDGITHSKGWERIWEYIYDDPITCH